MKKTYTDIKESKKLAEYKDLLKHCNKIFVECNDFLSNRKSVKLKETVYTCNTCPHQGNLICCHNCPNF